MSGNKDLVYSFKINTDEAKGKIPEVTGEAKTSVEGLAASVTAGGTSFQEWGAKVKEAAEGTGKMEVSVSELAHALNEGKINLDQYKAALGPIKDDEDKAAMALGRFTDAMRKLGAAEEEPKKLGRAVVTAKIAIEDLAASFTKLGKPIPPEMIASLKAAEDEVDRLNTKVGRYKDTVGDMAVKQKLAAQGMETMAQRGGSLQSMLGGLADSSEGVAGKFGKIGLATFGVIEAWKLGYETGQKIDKFLKEHGFNLADVFTKYILAAQGVKDYGNAIADWNLKAESAAAISARIRGEQAGLIASLKAGSAEWGKVAKEQAAWKEEAAKLVAVTKGFGLDMKALTQFAKDNAVELIDLAEKGTKLGLAFEGGDFRLGKLLRTAREFAAQSPQVAAAIGEAAGKIGEAYRKIADAGTASWSAQKHATEQGIKALNEAFQKGLIEQEEYAKKKKALHDAEVKAFDEATDKELAAMDAEKMALDELARKYGIGAEALKGLIQKHNDADKSARGAAAGSSALDAAVTALNEKTGALANAAGGATPKVDGLGKAAGAAHEPISKMEFIIGKAGEAGGKLGGGFKGATEGIDGTKRASTEFHTEGGKLVTTLDGLSKDDGPVKKLAGGFKGLGEKADDAATAHVTLTGKGKELHTSLELTAGEQGPVRKLEGGFKDVKTAAGNIIGENVKLMESLALLRTSMGLTIGVALELKRAMSDTAGGGGGGGKSDLGGDITGGPLP